MFEIRAKWIGGWKFEGKDGEGHVCRMDWSKEVGGDGDGFRPADPVLRLQDMERDGIRASIVYGAGALTGFPVEDPAIRSLILTTWNDWAAETFNSHAPDRLSALPFLPTGSPEEATAELERCAGLGHRGAIINPFDFDLKDDSWDRFWAAACAVDLPISFHIGKGTKLNPHDLRERAAFSSWSSCTLRTSVRARSAAAPSTTAPTIPRKRPNAWRDQRLRLSERTLPMSLAAVVMALAVWEWSRMG